MPSFPVEEREPVHEIELELVSGELTDLFEEAQRISDAVDGRLHTAHQSRGRLRAQPEAIADVFGRDRRELLLSPKMTAGKMSSNDHSSFVRASHRKRRLCPP